MKDIIQDVIIPDEEKTIVLRKAFGVVFGSNVVLTLEYKPWFHYHYRIYCNGGYGGINNIFSFRWFANKEFSRLVYRYHLQEVEQF